MKRLLAGLTLMIITVGLYAYDGSNNDNPYSTDNNYNNNASTNTESTTTNNSGNDKLLSEMNKKTTKGLKVFDTLLKDNGQSKQDFFSDVGSNPTAEQFEADDDEGEPVKNPFKDILGDKNS